MLIAFTVPLIVVAASVLGVDIQCLNGIGKVFGLSSGRTNLAMAIARRFKTPRGALFYAPDYGFSLINLLSSEMSGAQITAQGSAIEAEAMKDERVQSATATLNYTAATRSLIVTLVLEDADGPFTLILAANTTTVEILKAA